METELFKAIIQLGSTGIMCIVLWKIMLRYMDAHAASQNARIAALEEGHKECEAERQRLGATLIEELRGRARDRHARRHKGEGEGDGSE